MEENYVFTVEWIDPLTAQSYLARNISNRNKSEMIVETYARIMKAGKWTISNDAITFDVNNVLLNGQHRLYAIVKSGTTQQFLVARGYPSESADNMDEPKVRSASDKMKFKNVNDSVNVSSIVRRYLYLSNHRSVGQNHGPSMKFTAIEIMDEYLQGVEFWQDISKKSRKLYETGRFLSTTDYGGYMSYLIKGKNHPIDKVKSFFNELSSMADTTNNVTFLLRQILMNDKMSKYKMTSAKRQKLLIKTWNYWLTGKTVKVLSWNPSNEPDIWFL